MWILNKIQLEKCAGARQFIFRILAQQFLAKLIAGIILVLLIPNIDTSKDDKLFRDPGLAFLIIVIIAPPLETLLLQFLPIEIMRLFRRSKTTQFLAGAIPFAALHFPGGVVSGVAAGIVGGIFFSYAYLDCRKKSLWTAVRIVVSIHFLHNLIVLPFALIMASS